MLNPEYYKDEINGFFDFDKPAPVIFSNADALRKDCQKRENFIRSRSQCIPCDIVQFRAYFIQNNLLPSIKNVPIEA